MSEHVGYARVATGDQSVALQFDALHERGCQRIFRDVASGSLRHRAELARALDHVRAGDVLVVWSLDRVGRGLKHLIELVDDLKAREVGFLSITEATVTTTPQGTLQFQLFGRSPDPRALVADPPA